MLIFSGTQPRLWEMKWFSGKCLQPKAEEQMDLFAVITAKTMCPCPWLGK